MVPAAESTAASIAGSEPATAAQFGLLHVAARRLAIDMLRVRQLCAAAQLALLRPRPLPVRRQSISIHVVRRNPRRAAGATAATAAAATTIATSAAIAAIATGVTYSIDWQFGYASDFGRRANELKPVGKPVPGFSVHRRPHLERRVPAHQHLRNTGDGERVAVGAHSRRHASQLCCRAQPAGLLCVLPWLIRGLARRIVWRHDHTVRRRHGH